MACFHPFPAWYHTGQYIETGKKHMVFKEPREHLLYTKISLPCGQCIGCRIQRSRDWAMRCVHEASAWNQNCFITLTYNNEHLPSDGSLNHREFQLFMKRLRKRFPDVRIRFFMCGEYGSLHKRPHYHAILFNFNFPDLELWTVREGVSLFRSKILEELWPFGFSTIGDVTWESCAYVARYVLKKVNGQFAEEAYREYDVDPESGEITQHNIKPEYCTMSRRNGIGYQWFQQYHSDVFPNDYIVTYLKGKDVQLRVPRYYDKLYDLDYHDKFLDIKEKRLDKIAVMLNNGDLSPERLKVRELIQKNKLKKLVRPIEESPL